MGDDATRPRRWSSACPPRQDDKTRKDGAAEHVANGLRTGVWAWAERRLTFGRVCNKHLGDLSQHRLDHVRRVAVDDQRIQPGESGNIGTKHIWIEKDKTAQPDRMVVANA